MQRSIAKLNERWASQGRPEIGVGIGINHGEVFAGQHRQPPAARVHRDRRRGQRRRPALRRGGPGEILVSEALLGVVRDQVSCEFLPEMALKGKAQVVQVYRVRGIEAQRTSVTAAVPLRPSKR